MIARAYAYLRKLADSNALTFPTEKWIYVLVMRKLIFAMLIAFGATTLTSCYVGPAYHHHHGYCAYHYC